MVVVGVEVETNALLWLVDERGCEWVDDGLLPDHFHLSNKQTNETKTNTNTNTNKQTNQ